MPNHCLAVNQTEERQRLNHVLDCQMERLVDLGLRAKDLHTLKSAREKLIDYVMQKGYQKNELPFMAIAPLFSQVPCSHYYCLLGAGAYPLHRGGDRELMIMSENEALLLAYYRGKPDGLLCRDKLNSDAQLSIVKQEGGGKSWTVDRHIHGISNDYLVAGYLEVYRC